MRDATGIYPLFTMRVPMHYNWHPNAAFVWHISHPCAPKICKYSLDRNNHLNTRRTSVSQCNSWPQMYCHKTFLQLRSLYSSASCVSYRLCWTKKWHKSPNIAKMYKKYCWCFMSVPHIGKTRQTNSFPNTIYNFTSKITCLMMLILFFLDGTTTKANNFFAPRRPLLLDA